MIELKKVSFLKDAIEALSSFVPEGNFRFADKGIFFRAIDPSQVVLVDYFIEKSLFDKYSIEPSFVGVDLVELNKILQRAFAQDKMILDLTDAELKIKFESELKRSFNLPLIDVSEEEAKEEIRKDILREIEKEEKELEKEEKIDSASGFSEDLQ